MASFRLKRKTFGVGAIFGANNFKAMTSGVKTLADGTTKNLGTAGKALEGAKGVAKLGALGATAGVGTIAYRGGSDLLSGGEKSAKEMSFSDNEETQQQQSSMSTGKKVALGTLGTVGAAGLAFAGAKRGAFGNKAMLQANKAWGNAGAYISKAGMTGTGGKMMKSGSEGITKAQTEIAKGKLSGKSNYNIQSAGGVDSLASKSGQNVSRIYENKWNNIINPS